MTNPDYLARVAPLAAAYLAGSDTESVGFDPFRVGWDTSRGRSLLVSWRNRYGARIVGRIYGPKRWDPTPHPAVVLVPGGGSREDDYQGIAQSLAEAGYVVLGFDPQGQGRSDAAPSPQAMYCDAKGAWRQPQEAGLREHGTCAGVPPEVSLDSPVRALVAPVDDTPAGPPLQTAEALATYRTDREAFFEHIDDMYSMVGPNYAFGALDAADFLTSSANPWRSHVDADRVAAIGHSLGAWGAVVAANGDPRRRFAAAAGFDGFGTVPAGAPPTVPTLFLAAENIDTDYPVVPAPDPDDGLPWLRQAKRWRSSDIDAAQIVLRGSTHLEWYYLPFRLLNPVTGPLVNASSRGERVSVYYLLAWLDLQLRAGHKRALARLTARVFDATADASSIGQGTYDVRAAANRPYEIKGRRVADHLSPLFRSAIDVDGVRCKDLRSGCRRRQ